MAARRDRAASWLLVSSFSSYGVGRAAGLAERLLPDLLYYYSLLIFSFSAA